MGCDQRSTCERLQCDLNSLKSGKKSGRWPFHPDKCNVLCVNRSRSPIVHDRLYSIWSDSQTTRHCEISCVTIHSKLSWNDHISNVVKKGNSSIGFLRRNLQISQKHIKANAYKALVRSQLEYASVVWDPYTQTNQDKLEMVQRRAARFVFNNYSRDASVSETIKELGWRSLQQRRADNMLTMMYKIIHGYVSVDFTDELIPVTIYTRYLHPHCFLLPTEEKAYLQNSFLPRTIRQWNRLPVEVATAATPASFRSGACVLKH